MSAGRREVVAGRVDEGDGVLEERAIVRRTHVPDEPVHTEHAGEGRQPGRDLGAVEAVPLERGARVGLLVR